MYKNISMLQLKSEIAPMVPAKHLLIIADACFGGLLLDTRSASVAASHKTSYHAYPVDTYAPLASCSAAVVGLA